MDKSTLTLFSARPSFLLARFIDGIDISISLGVSSYLSGDNVKAMLERVDAALYAAKEGGRNRTCVG